MKESREGEQGLRGAAAVTASVLLLLLAVSKLCITSDAASVQGTKLYLAKQLTGRQQSYMSQGQSRRKMGL